MTVMPANKEREITGHREEPSECAPKRRERRKILTSERAIAAVATALATYFVTRSELAAKTAPSPESITTLQSTVTGLQATVSTLQTTVTTLQATVTKLEGTVNKLELKVDALTDSKTSFDAALNAFRLTNQTIEFRLSRVENDLARMPARKQ